MRLKSLQEGEINVFPSNCFETSMDGTSLNSEHCSPFQQWKWDEHQATSTLCTVPDIRSCRDSDSLEAHLLVLFNSVFQQVQSHLQWAKKKKISLATTKARQVTHPWPFVLVSIGVLNSFQLFSKYSWTSNHSRVYFWNLWLHKKKKKKHPKNMSCILILVPL